MTEPSTSPHPAKPDPHPAKPDPPPPAGPSTSPHTSQSLPLPPGEGRGEGAATGAAAGPGRDQEVVPNLDLAQAARLRLALAASGPELAALLREPDADLIASALKNPNL